MRERGEGRGQGYARDLPVAGGGILPGGALRGPAPGADRGFVRRDVQARQMPEAHVTHVGNLQIHTFGHMAQGIGPLVAISRRVGKISGANGIQYDQNGFFHGLSLLY